MVLPICAWLLVAATPNPKWHKVDVNPTAPFEAAGAADLDGDGRVDLLQR